MNILHFGGKESGDFTLEDLREKATGGMGAVLITSLTVLLATR